MSEEDAAIALWKEWLEDGGKPEVEYGSHDCCFFCGRYKPDENGHDNDCIYVRLVALLENVAV